MRDRMPSVLQRVQELREGRGITDPGGERTPHPKPNRKAKVSPGQEYSPQKTCLGFCAKFGLCLGFWGKFGLSPLSSQLTISYKHVCQLYLCRDPRFNGACEIRCQNWAVPEESTQHPPKNNQTSATNATAKTYLPGPNTKHRQSCSTSSLRHAEALESRWALLRSARSLVPTSANVAGIVWADVHSHRLRRIRIATCREVTIEPRPANNDT